MNKKILFSGISILSMLGLLVGGAFAAFSSTASNTGNTFGAGTLVLAINGAPNSASTHVFSVTNALPGDTSTQVLDLSNTGTVNAAATVLNGISLTPNAVGDLGEVLTLQLYKDTDNSGTVTAGDVLINTAHLNSASWTALPLGFPLLAGGHQKVLAVLTFDSGAGNPYQGKSVSFDFNFQANQ